jgi:hypothetical protein
MSTYRVTLSAESVLDDARRDVDEGFEVLVDQDGMPLRFAVTASEARCLIAQLEAGLDVLQGAGVPVGDSGCADICT